MKLRSPIVAILWELWRVTRVEVAWKLAVGIIGGLAVLALSATFAPADNARRHEDVMDLGAAVAMTLLVVPHIAGWFSLARLNGGRPEFPLYLHYTRPVRTAVIVGLPMVYLTAVSWAIYLASALLLRATSGYAFPLLPVAVWMAAFSLIWVAATWSTRNRTLQLLVMMFAVGKAFGLAMDRLTAVELPGGYDWPPRLWPTLFDFPRTDYAWIALIGLASFGVTVAGVARQRRGDGWVKVPSTQRDGWWDRLVSIFRFRCPTSSATRAQVWFDLKSSGLPLLAIGVALAIVILLVSAVSGPIDAALNANPRVSCPIEECFYVRAWPPLLAPLSLFIMLFLGGNAFGIRWRQGRAYVSAFEATQPHAAAPLAALRLLVRAVCVLAALTAIGASGWISMPLLGDAVFIQMWSVPLNSQRSAISGAVASLTGYEQLALAVVAIVGVAVWVASWTAIGALRTRYRRPMNVALCLLLLYGVALVWLGVGIRVDPDTASQFHLNVVYGAMRWIAAAAILFTTVYVFWTGFAERLLTIRYASGALAISAGFGAAWLTVLHIAGVQPAGMSAMNAISVVSPAVLPLMAGGLAPWSYSRVRHT